jgi:2,3-dihydroxybenzoate decarboxylase
MDGKIAVEEHWAIDETLNIAGQPVPAGAFWDATRRLLIDFHDRRIANMDAHGIEFAIVGLNSPALQAILDPADSLIRQNDSSEKRASGLRNRPTALTKKGAPAGAFAGFCFRW